MTSDTAFGPSLSNRSPIRFGQLAAGLVLAGIGCVFFADQQGWLDAGRLNDYWPMILVVLGFGRLFDGGRRTRSGAVLLTLGLLLQLDQLRLLRFRESWPLVLVAAGVALAWGAFMSGRQPEVPPPPPSADSDSVEPPRG